jgi:hypothetical protein
MTHTPRSPDQVAVDLFVDQSGDSALRRVASPLCGRPGQRGCADRAPPPLWRSLRTRKSLPARGLRPRSAPFAPRRFAPGTCGLGFRRGPLPRLRARCAPSAPRRRRRPPRFAGRCTASLRSPCAIHALAVCCASSPGPVRGLLRGCRLRSCGPRFMAPRGAIGDLGRRRSLGRALGHGGRPRCRFATGAVHLIREPCIGRLPEAGWPPAAAGGVGVRPSYLARLGRPSLRLPAPAFGLRPGPVPADSSRAKIGRSLVGIGPAGPIFWRCDEPGFPGLRAR